MILGGHRSSCCSRVKTYPYESPRTSARASVIDTPKLEERHNQGRRTIYWSINDTESEPGMVPREILGRPFIKRRGS